MDLERTKKLILLHEAKRPHAYKDSRGILTIGIGRNIQKGSGPGLREEEMQYMLNCDVRDAIRDCEHNIPAFRALDDARQAVLVDMCHNLGIGGLLGFKKMLAHLAKEEFSEAASEMIRSVWAVQVKDRAPRLARMMDSGQWPDQH